jgi:hypothetical protein
MRLFLDIDEDSKNGRYLLACARIRNISVRSLLRRLISDVAEDQLIPSILDDADDMKARRKGEHQYRSRESPP